MSVDQNIKRVLDLIVCPACQGSLSLQEKDSSLLCNSCGRCYSIQDGIPVLIAERAAI